MACLSAKPLPQMSPERIGRFHTHVQKGSASECWRWLGVTQGRYGVVKINQEHWLAHRIAYYIATSVDPGDLRVCHHCDFPLCCNPAHLFPGTVAMNQQDAARKNRLSRKLTSAQVTDIRILHRDFEYSETALGRIFGVTQNMISKIVLYRERRFDGHIPQ